MWLIPVLAVAQTVLSLVVAAVVAWVLLEVTAALWASLKDSDR